MHDNLNSFFDAYMRPRSLKGNTTIEYRKQISYSEESYLACPLRLSKELCVHACTYFLMCTLSHVLCVCFHEMCAYTLVYFHETCTFHASNKRVPHKHITGMQCSICMVPHVMTCGKMKL